MSLIQFEIESKIIPPAPLGGEGGGEGCKDVEKRVGEGIRVLDREADRRPPCFYRIA